MTGLVKVMVQTASYVVQVAENFNKKTGLKAASIKPFQTWERKFLSVIFLIEGKGPLNARPFLGRKRP